jgi:hypothetical protein
MAWLGGSGPFADGRHNPGVSRLPETCHTSYRTENVVQMRKNYGQVRRQREFAKKVRQLEKKQRRTARLSTAAATADAANPADESGTAAKPFVRDAS